MVFHKGSNCDYHFIIKEQVKEFEGEFNCLGENTEICNIWKYQTFSAPITKEVKSIGKNGQEQRSMRRGLNVVKVNTELSSDTV